MYAIEANNISKAYQTGKNSITALNNLMLQVLKGEMFGLIGPDGAGKTSLMRILTTLLLADSGQASVVGLNVITDFKKIRQIIGYMPGKFSLYQDLSVQENLHFFATIFNTTISQNFHLIKDIYEQIEPFKDRRAGNLSGGMKQKLALCCALIHKPAVLLLDEPTTGVDAVSRKEFWQMLHRLKAEGISILVATPYMDEASLCDRVALMQAGRFLQIDTPANIIHQHQQQLWAAKSNQMFELLPHLRQHPQVASAYLFGEYYHITPKNNWANASMLATYLQQLQHTAIEVKQIKPNIEDIFIHLMNQPNA